MVNYKNISTGVDNKVKKDIIILNSLTLKNEFMNKLNDSIPVLWREDRAVVIGNLYNFPEPIKAASLAVSKETPVNKKVIADNDLVRTFRTARLFQINEETEKFFFIGHKVPEPGCKKSNRKYVFVLPFPK